MRNLEVWPGFKASCMWMPSYFFAGVEENDSIRRYIYNGADVILMCFSIDSDYSFKNIAKKWLPEVERFCPKGNVISQSLLTIIIFRYVERCHVVCLLLFGCSSNGAGWKQERCAKESRCSRRTCQEG